MTTVADAIRDTGLEQPSGTELVLVSWAPNGGPRHHRFDDVAGTDLDQWDDLYCTTGVLKTGSIRDNTGRTGENVVQVLALPFDADLSDYLMIGHSKEDQAEILAMSQADIDLNIRAQIATLEAAFADLGVPIHRLDYTGHGLCAYVYLRDTSPHDLAAIQAAHKTLIARINDRERYHLVDPAVSDAGTRVTRVPGTRNTKGVVPRTVQTLSSSWRIAQRLSVAQLVALGGTAETPRQRATITSFSGKALPDGIVSELVDAMTPHWTAGQKHVVALGFAGMLAKAGVPEAQALAIVEQLSAGDLKPWDRAACVRTTYQRLATGINPRGYRALEEYLPAEALAFIDERLQRFRESAVTAGPRLIAGGKSTGEKKTGTGTDADPVKTVTYPVVPEGAYYGWFGRYRDLMAPTTEAPDCFHLGAALTLAGAMVGRKVWTRYASDQLYPNFYTLLIGASGSSRKDTAIKRAIQMPQVAMTARRLSPPAFAIRRDISSGEGLVAILKDEPNILLYISELTTMLRNIKRESTKSLGDKLIEAWDTPSTLQNLNKQSPIYAANPYLSIISGTQPGRLEEEMTDTEINSGFGNRWMFFAGSAKPRMATPPDVDEAAAAVLYSDLMDAIRFYGEDHCLRLTADARPRWDAWYLADDIDEHDEDRQAMRIRHASLIQKTALLFAVSDAAPDIEDRHLDAAIQLIEWMWAVVQQLMPTWGSTLDRKIEERIFAVLRRNGPVPRRYLQQRTASRKWSGRDFASVFKAMLENGVVQVDAIGTVSLPSDHLMRGAS